MMDKRLTVIYADAAEKFVKNVVLYAKEGVLYYDEAHTEVVNGAELQNLFLKGLIIHNATDNSYSVPSSCALVGENMVLAVPSPDGLEYSTNPIVNEEEAEQEE